MSSSPVYLATRADVLRRPDVAFDLSKLQGPGAAGAGRGGAGGRCASRSGGRWTSSSCVFDSVHQRPPPTAQVHRASIYGRRGRDVRWPVKVRAPWASPRRFEKDPRGPTMPPPASRALRSGPRRLRRSLWWTRSPSRCARVWTSASSRRHLRDDGEQPGGFEVSRAGGGVGRARATVRSLTMEWMTAIKYEPRRRLARGRPRSPPDLARRVLQTFLRHAMRDGFFHARHASGLISSWRTTGRWVAGGLRHHVFCSRDTGGRIPGADSLLAASSRRNYAAWRSGISDARVCAPRTRSGPFRAGAEGGWRAHPGLDAADIPCRASSLQLPRSPRSSTLHTSRRLIYAPEDDGVVRGRRPPRWDPRLDMMADGREARGADGCTNELAPRAPLRKAQDSGGARLVRADAPRRPSSPSGIRPDRRTL